MIKEIEERAVVIWEQFKAEEINGPEFVAGIRSLEMELPDGMTIRFA